MHILACYSAIIHKYKLALTNLLWVMHENWLKGSRGLIYRVLTAFKGRAQVPALALIATLSAQTGANLQ